MSFLYMLSALIGLAECVIQPQISLSCCHVCTSSVHATAYMLHISEQNKTSFEICDYSLWCWLHSLSVRRLFKHRIIVFVSFSRRTLVNGVSYLVSHYSLHHECVPVHQLIFPILRFKRNDLCCGLMDYFTLLRYGLLRYEFSLLPFGIEENLACNSRESYS